MRKIKKIKTGPVSCEESHSCVSFDYFAISRIQIIIFFSIQKYTVVTACCGGVAGIVLQYALGDDCDRLTSTALLRVCVRVCGVLLADVQVSAATFDGRSAGRLCGQHQLVSAISIAVHPRGTHLVSSRNHSLDVYELPDMNLMFSLGSHGDSQANLNSPLSLCFTDAGTLLVDDYLNNRIQHWTLEGLSIASYAFQGYLSRCVASRGNLFIVGTNDGARICSLENGAVLHAWINPDCDVYAAVFVDADTLAVSNTMQMTIDLYTLNGMLLKQLAVGIMSYGIAACTNGCILVTDFHKNCVRVFEPDGTELTTSPLTAHKFRLPPKSIVLCEERAYVLEMGLGGIFHYRICMFE